MPSTDKRLTSLACGWTIEEIARSGKRKTLEGFPLFADRKPDKSQVRPSLVPQVRGQIWPAGEHDKPLGSECQAIFAGRLHSRPSDSRTLDEDASDRCFRRHASRRCTLPSPRRRTQVKPDSLRMEEASSKTSPCIGLHRLDTFALMATDVLQSARIWISRAGGRRASSVAATAFQGDGGDGRSER